DAGLCFGFLSSTTYPPARSLNYGGPGYTAVPEDYDGDGRTDVGVYNYITGDWSILLSSTNYTTSLSESVGGAGYFPAPADYDGDGKADFVVYSYGAALWFGYTSGSGYASAI